MFGLLLSLALVPYPRSVIETGGACVLSNVLQDVRISQDPTLGPEAYRLDIRTNGVLIVHSDEAGAFYAKMTLAQLGAGCVPCMRIDDSPAYKWRGLLLDEGRHFFGKEIVKRTLDRMSEYKLNVFHWHLTEDQGWRLAIEKFPELVKYGSVRPESVCHGCTGVPERDGPAMLRTNGTPYGPYYYTRQDVKEILEYAAERHIRVLPEIEIPGHVRSLLAAHPEFSCAGRVPRHAAVLNSVFEEVLCAGNEEALRYVERIYDSVCDMFPDAYVHIGGDECPKKAWKACPKCQVRIRELGLRDETALQGWVTRRFTEYLAKKGRRAIGWDEVLAGKPSSETIIQVWHSPEYSVAAATNGYDVIVSNLALTYFSLPQGLADDPFTYLSSDRKLTLEMAYGFDPARNIPKEALSRIIGAECCNWSECTWNIYDLEWKMFPRVCAFAEAVWTAPEAPRDFREFLHRMRKRRQDLRSRGVNCAPLECSCR